jgi:tryptophan halogenase
MKLVIVGGGTAGWLTALYLNKIAPDYNITLIESEEIGILGAGEGSVPIFPYFLYNLGISEEEIIKETDATFKLGINFENWKGDGTKYMHGFGVDDKSLNFEEIVKSGNVTSVGLTPNGTNYTITNLIANGHNLDDSLITHLLSYNNKSPYLYIDNMFKKVVSYSYHFDATLMAKFLRKKAEERGVKRIEGVVTDFINNKEGNINSIKLVDDITISNIDFVFDCSGFKRLIIGKHYGSEWISYENQLKVNCAIPFFIEKEPDITKPHTDAIAMKYGWMWKIPLQSRYGCGYIFDKKYINVEEAKKEVEEMLGKEIKINKVIDFNAGRYKDVWIKNCISIGLSAGFTEPIEATSVWIAISQLSYLTKMNFTHPSDLLREEYNEYFNNFNDSILDFLYYHYLTERDDTPFWKEYKERTILPKTLEKKLKTWKERTPNIFDRNKVDTFPIISYIEVGVGLCETLIPKETFKKENETYLLDGDFSRWMETYRYNVEQAMKTSIDNKKLIEMIKNVQ